VVAKHQGKIFFETEEGRGTTFVVRLPLNGESDPGIKAE
jgi:signal transduction histidine kinase